MDKPAWTPTDGSQAPDGCPSTSRFARPSADVRVNRTRPYAASSLLARGAHRLVSPRGTSCKRQDALRLGAAKFVVSASPEELVAQANRLDFILDTVSAAHDVSPYLRCLRRDGHLVLVGFPAKPLEVRALSRFVIDLKSLEGFAGSARPPLG
nr:zinc-binding dehydrogenase [Myxococcus sp. RHSTA-1-4]